MGDTLNGDDRRGFLWKLELETVTKDGRTIRILFADTTRLAVDRLMEQIRSRSFCNDVDKTFAVISGAAVLTERRRARRHKVGDDGAEPTNPKGI